jgi:D-3-phosphoglycerate dehydrogenase / 2-oxoglutarate reductase
MKVLVATEKAFAPVAVTIIRDIIEKAGHELSILANYKSEKELLNAITDAEGLIVRSDKVTSEVVGAAKKLRIVVRAGAGYDNIDLQACSAQDIVAMNTPGQNSNAVAELVFMLMLFNARRGFTGKSGTELRGKTLGLHAFGNVGRHVAAIANGFGMVVYAYDPFVSSQEMDKYKVSLCTGLNDLYSRCRYVSLHMPANNDTIRSVGYDLLKQMPEDAVLVNTARKEVIDEEGLLKIFGERSDFSYLSDVMPDNRPVFEEKYTGRFIFTEKKMGAQTAEANINAGVAAARQIVDYFLTGNERFRINK